MELLQEAIIKTRAHQQIEIAVDPHKGNKRKHPEEDLRRSRNMNKQRIIEITINIVESGQYTMLIEAFSEVDQVNQ